MVKFKFSRLLFALLAFLVAVVGVAVASPKSASAAVTEKVTASVTNGYPGFALKVLVLNNAVEAGGAGVAGQTTAGVAKATLTPTSSHSLPVFGLASGSTSQKYTAASGNTFWDNSAAGSWSYGTGRYTGTVTAGTPVTVGSTAPNGQYQSWAAYEVKPSGSTTPALDASTPASVYNGGGSSASSASFSPPAGSVLVAVVDANGLGSGSNLGFSVTDTAGLTWTKRQASAANNEGSAVYTATVPGSVSQVPAVPTGLTASGTTSSTTTLNWTAPTGTVTGYNVYRNGVKVQTVTGTSATDTGLTASTSYTYTVSAYNSVGEGPQSSAVQVTTLASGGTGGLPAGVTLRNIDGGPNYYCSNGFTYACNAGWDSASFFPVVDDYAFYPGNSTATFKDLGLTTSVRVTGGTDMSVLRNAGVSAIPGDDGATNFGSETTGAHVEEPGSWTDITNGANADNNLYGTAGRFFQPSFTWNQLYYGSVSGSVCGASGSMNMQQVMSCTSGMPGGRHLDIPTDDEYWFAASNTSFGQTYPGGHIYNNGVQASAAQMAQGSNYGDMVDTMRGWLNAPYAPSAPYIETEDGLLTDAGVREITPPELNWAAWSTIVHGARMLMYFGTTSNYGSGSTFGFSKNVLPGQSVSVYDQAKATNGLVHNLAPVINSPFALGYVTANPGAYSFPTPHLKWDTGIDVMAKDYSGGTFTNPAGTFTNGFYIFASPRGAESRTNFNATFTTADNYTGPVTVINENRTVQATNGQFTDTFANGSTVHIYKIG